MSLKKRSKVSAEFSMSSLTDIIFLLLIFFMLTSSLVAPNSLNLKLPGSSRERVPSQDRLPTVLITNSGTYRLNGNSLSIGRLERELRTASRSVSGRLNLVIETQTRTPVEAVTAVMDIALRYNINGILATE